MDNILEKKILKLAISEKRIIDKLLEQKITKEHFHDSIKSKNSKILANIYSLAVNYSVESSGSLLTSDVFTSKINELNVADDIKSDILAEWMDVQKMSVAADDFHQLLQEIKTNHASKLLDLELLDLQQNLKGSGLKEAVSKFQLGLEKINNEFSVYDTEKKVIDISKRAEEFATEYDLRFANKDKYKGITFGTPDIDEKTFGIFPGQVVVLLAPSSGGKSVQMMNWAIHANMVCKKKVLYFSFEMEAWQCELRHISNLFEVPYWKIKSQSLSDTERRALFETYKYNNQEYFEYDVNIEDPTPEYVDARIRELTDTKGKPDLVVVDYIGNMSTRNAPKSQKPWEKQGDAFEQLFKLAKRHHIPFLTAQQINRETIRENRKKKEAGITSAYFQDAASGDQRLMHYAHFVIGLEPDKENNLAVYHPVKMRDAWFEPCISQWDTTYNKVLPLTQEDQKYWKKIKGMIKNDEEDSFGTAPKKYVSMAPEDEEEVPWSI